MDMSGIPEKVDIETTNRIRAISLSGFEKRTTEMTDSLLALNEALRCRINGVDEKLRVEYRQTEKLVAALNSVLDGKLKEYRR